MPKRLYSKRIFDITEGEWRVFFNFYHYRQRITFGFPKKGSRFNDVYFMIDDEEQDRITISEAKSYMTRGMIEVIGPMVKGLSSKKPFVKRYERGKISSVKQLPTTNRKVDSTS